MQHLRRLKLNYVRCVGVPKVGGYYDPALLPDYRPELFDLEKDKLIQHNIVDEEDQIVPCWSLYDRLRPGTLLLCKVTLHGWNIGIREGKFKRVSLSLFQYLSLLTVRYSSIR